MCPLQGLIKGIIVALLLFFYYCVCCFWGPFYMPSTELTVHLGRSSILAALLVDTLPCARSERCEDGADLWENGRGGRWREGADAAGTAAE